MLFECCYIKLKLLSVFIGHLFLFFYFFCSVNVLLSNLISTGVCCSFSPMPFAMNVSMKNFRKANSARWPQIASQFNSTETYMWGSLCHEAFESCIFRSLRTRWQGGVWIQLCAVLCWGPDGKGCRRGCCRRTWCPQLCSIEHNHTAPTNALKGGNWLLDNWKVG